MKNSIKEPLIAFSNKYRFFFVVVCLKYYHCLQLKPCRSHYAELLEVFDDSQIIDRYNMTALVTNLQYSSCLDKML